MSKMIKVESCGDCPKLSPYNEIWECEKLNEEVHEPSKILPNCPLDDYSEGIEEKLEKIKNWCQSYPLSVFPEPDFIKAHKVLKDNGMTLDAISASNMRHVLEGIVKIIEEIPK